ncbi:GGDEF domain-containing protein [Caminibacter pacificus]|uniref:diguanylate cyclase n=1 Tax=Caminibacter pacificus TaxID=1424653 RepID=A0AAJ4UYD6_9BACT|nr:GGDEF domain-containing protein [Caminibacter pacificus]NPA87413.1 GGDEF domain-containing protein [Campylobacterota bacterium]QCI28425.1 GGDEF domain-containing protein [Caminibacter pacificus]ROR40850.1 diguanylate cyclase (GGDEF)-like protein [Caminibacter pacificus]
MEELIKEIANKTMQDLEKAKKPPYPLYYRDVFNAIANEKGILNQLNPKLLCIAPTLDEIILAKTSETISEISIHTKDIKNDSREIIDEVNVADADEIKEMVIKFSANLIEKVNQMEERIQELQSELDKAYKELLIDPLTKVYNRKALEKDLGEILEKGKDRNLDLVIAIVDIDNFKMVNDKYGHLVGDFVLIKLADTMKSLIRKSDKIYRYGGDEFIIVFNRSTLENAEKSIERIIYKIYRTTLKYKENYIKITISAGITQHRAGDTIESMIKRADEALYKAKVEKNGYKIL